MLLEFSDEPSTRAFGAALAAALQPGTVIELNGPLGAGKTTFVRAVAAARGVPEDEVSSPTFVLIHEYAGDIPIYHFDAYRLKNVDEFLDLGAEEYLNSQGVCLIEWGEKVASVLPPDRIVIEITPTGHSSRQFRLVATGPASEPILHGLSPSGPKPA